MIIKSFELDKLNSYNFNLHLIYGYNEGIKEDIINNKYLKDFSGEVLKYEEQELLNSKDEFISSLLTKSLFETNKLIIVSRCSDKLSNLLAEILENEKLDWSFVLSCIKHILTIELNIKIIFLGFSSFIHLTLGNCCELEKFKFY